MPLASYSVVIATYERPDDLGPTLAGIHQQTHLPLEVIVVDSSNSSTSRDVCEQWKDRLPLRWMHSKAKSAARQRNQGADATTAASEIIAFVDDDITMHPATCAEICQVFADDKEKSIGGIAARIDEIQRPAPSRAALAYYRLQAGYDHPTYGGRLFGAAVNCLPSYNEEAEAGGALIPGQWLNSTCVFYRRDVFLREKFPLFDNYSYMEDVHCSGRIAKTHRLYFHTRAGCSHRDGTNSFKRDHFNMARQRIRNQRIVAREVMGLNGASLVWKFFLHRLFATCTIVRNREPGWTQALRGTWM